MSQVIEEIVTVFKDEPVYDKLFSEFKKKYESLGRIGGAVSLDEYSRDEIDTIARFFGLRIDILMSKGKVTLLQFEKQLKQYKGDTVNLKAVLESYFNVPLVSNKERSDLKSVELWCFFDRLKLQYPYCSPWLDYIEGKPSDSRWIYRMIDNSFEKFSSYVAILERTLESLPTNPIRLPVFAQQVTGNPHAFDRNQSTGRLLVHLLAVKRGLSNNDAVTIPNTSEDISDLLLNYNMLKDDITNYITVANLLAKTNSNKESLWKAASETRSVLNVPIRELLDIEKLYPDQNFKEVWVVENSGIFSSILDEVPDIPLICTHGQFKLSAWKCFDLLVDGGYTLNYSSDMDPEGMGMAERLFNRYPDSVELWKMDSVCYEKAVSKDEMISAIRLNQLKNLSNTQLKEVSYELIETKSPAYQEALLDEMVEELKQKVKDQL